MKEVEGKGHNLCCDTNVYCNAITAFEELQVSETGEVFTVGPLFTMRSPRTTSLDTTRPPTIFYRLLLN
jgi:hypothetical protein